MPYFPPEMPRPVMTRDSREFWEACTRHELAFQRCSACGTFRHPPESCCPRCRSFGYAWTRVAGRGRIFSYAIVHRPFLPALASHVPYTVIVVELDGAPGVRLISNLVETKPEVARVGLPVEVIWDDVASDLSVPRFRPGR